MTDLAPPRAPAQRRRGGAQRETMTPARLGALGAAVIQGDSINAATASALIPMSTYQRWRTQGEAAINQARTLMETDDIEGRLWAWIEEGGGFGTCDARSWYWTAKAPRWWPSELKERWRQTVMVAVVLYARARAEQVYRASVTRAAQGDARNGIAPDWKAAQFMLTHSFGWQDASRIELTGANGGPIEMQASEEAVLATLHALAQRRRAIEE